MRSRAQAVQRTHACSPAAVPVLPEPLTCVQGDPAQVLPQISVCTVLDAMRTYYAAPGQAPGSHPHEPASHAVTVSAQEMADLRAALMAVCGHLMEARMRLVGSFRPEDVQVSPNCQLSLALAALQVGSVAWQFGAFLFVNCLLPGKVNK